MGIKIILTDKNILIDYTETRESFGLRVVNNISGFLFVIHRGQEYIVNVDHIISVTDLEPIKVF